MAQQTTVRFVDDLDGSDAAGTFDFSLDGRQYQVDLSDDNAAKLREALAPFIGVARKTGGRGRRTQRQTAMSDTSVRSSREDTRAIREWARENGHKVSDRGRISGRSWRRTRRRVELRGQRLVLRARRCHSRHTAITTGAHLRSSGGGDQRSVQRVGDT